MRVNVDEARRDRAARRVEFTVAAELRTDRFDATIGDGDVGDAARFTGAVVHRAAAYDELSHTS